MAKRSRPPRSIGLQTEPQPLVRSRPPTARDPRQPQLPFDPMPARVEPALALLATEPPTGPDWAFEIKWDGYRLAIHVEPSAVRILTRGGHDWTDRFPSIVAAARALDAGTMILDGEAVVLDPEGRSDFGALQRALGGRGGKKVAGPEVILFAFDLLYLDGHDLTGMSLSERRHLLEDVLDGATGAIRLSEEIAADGAALLSTACSHGLEGIIAKHRDRPYRPGRRGDWLKIKCVASDTFVVVGYEPSTKVRGAIASLLLAARRGKDLVFVGAVGTGFPGDTARALKTRLDAIPGERLAEAPRARTLRFAKPVLFAEIEYRGFTDEGRLRHAAFKGLRQEADMGDLFELPGRS